MQNSDEDFRKSLRRNRRICDFVYKTFGGSICRIKDFHFQPCFPKEDTALVLANHNTDWDPFFLYILLGRFVRFVASANVTQGFPGALIRWAAGPIPRPKGASADTTVEQIRNTLSHGCSVAMFPEGGKSWDGKTGFISPRTAALVKEAAGGLITVRLEGGYLKEPKWAVHSRKGPIFGSVVREYTREELQRMSAEEILQAICRDLNTDEYETQKRRMKPYPGRGLAEGIENAVYLCPVCGGIGTIHGKRDQIRCEKCGMSARYTEYGFLESDTLRFQTVEQWNAWQKQWLRSRAEALRLQKSAPIFVDNGVSLRVRKNGKKHLLAKNAVVELYGDRILVRSSAKAFEYPLSQISRMGDFRISRVYFTCEGQYCELFRKNSMAAQKYFAFWRTLMGKNYQ